MHLHCTLNNLSYLQGIHFAKETMKVILRKLMNLNEISDQKNQINKVNKAFLSLNNNHN